MSLLGKIEGLLSGKKTYIIVLLIAIGAGLKTYGIVIPEVAWAILAALGLGAVRSAISKVEKT